MSLDSHAAPDGSSSGLQWPWDVAAMALLMRASGAKKALYSEGEELVRDPDVLRRRRSERMHCSSAGNGWTLHQASRA
jgi:fructose-1,6-bisphosphatase/inositol monophosphatase family enzyme